MATKQGTIIVELWKRPLAPHENRPSGNLHSAIRCGCKKTAKRFIITRGVYCKQFDHAGNCVVNQSKTYWAVALPETFVEVV